MTRHLAGPSVALVIMLSACAGPDIHTPPPAAARVAPQRVTVLDDSYVPPPKMKNHDLSTVSSRHEIRDGLHRHTRELVAPGSPDDAASNKVDVIQPVGEHIRPAPVVDVKSTVLAPPVPVIASLPVSAPISAHAITAAPAPDTDILSHLGMAPFDAAAAVAGAAHVAQTGASMDTPKR